MNRALVGIAAFSTVLLAPLGAEAHFKLQQPADWLQTDSYGNPLGTNGTQKLNPCGDGTPSGAVTQVRAGSVLHIKLTETIPHGGHYRVAIVPKVHPASSDLPEPAVTLDGSGQCASAAIESTPVAPVLADGLFPHTQAQATAGQVWETDVQLPNEVGTATLQVLEFMTPHPPQCFYHHCAQLEIVAADAGIADDAGVAPGPDASNDPDAGQGGGVDGGGPAFGPSSGSTASSGGCSVGFAVSPGFGAAGALALAALWIVRRRRRD